MAFKGPSDYLIKTDDDGVLFLDDSDMDASGNLYHVTQVFDPAPGNTKLWGYNFAVKQGYIACAKYGSTSTFGNNLKQGQSVILYDHSGQYGDSDDGASLNFGPLRYQYEGYNFASNETNRNFGYGGVDFNHGIIAIHTPYDPISTFWNNTSDHILDVYSLETGEYLWGTNANFLGAEAQYDIEPSDGNWQHSVAVGCGRIVSGWGGDGTASNSNGGRVAVYNYWGDKIKAGDGNLLGMTDAGAASDVDNFGFGNSVFVKHGRIFVVAHPDSSMSADLPFVSIFDLDGEFINAISLKDIQGQASTPYYSGDGEYGNVLVGCGRIIMFTPHQTETNKCLVSWATLDGFIYKTATVSLINFEPQCIAGGKIYSIEGSSGSERVVVYDINLNKLYDIPHTAFVSIGETNTPGFDHIKGFGNTVLVGNPTDDHSSYSNNGSLWMIKTKQDTDSRWETILENIY
jgi:hypothetical protein